MEWIVGCSFLFPHADADADADADAPGVVYRSVDNPPARA